MKPEELAALRRAAAIVNGAEEAAKVAFEKARVEGAVAERARIMAILGTPVAQARPTMARKLCRGPALTPKQAEALLAQVEPEGSCEFARAFPHLAARALAEAEEPTEDEEMAAFLGRMKRFDEQLVAEEIELRGHRARQRGDY